MAPHPEPGRAGGCLVRAHALEPPTRGRELDHRRDDRRRGNGEVHRDRDARTRARRPIFARRAVVVVGMPAVYQSTAPKSSAFVPSVATIGLRRIRPIRKPFSRAGGDGREEGDADRRQEPRVVAGRVLGHDHDVERQPAGDREVDPALHDDERLAERGDRQRRGERQHRQERAPGEARRGEEEAHGEQPDRRDEHGRKPARQEAPSTPAGWSFDPSGPADLRLRRHVVADTNADRSRSQGLISCSSLLRVTLSARRSSVAGHPRDPCMMRLPDIDI